MGGGGWRCRAELGVHRCGPGDMVGTQVRVVGTLTVMRQGPLRAVERAVTVDWTLEDRGTAGSF